MLPKEHDLMAGTRLKKVKDWAGALICAAIAFRAVFYLGSKVYFGIAFDMYDLAAGVIGLVAGYIGYLYLRLIFGGYHVAA